MTTSSRCCTQVSDQTSRGVLGIDDLSDAEIDAILSRAGELADGAAPATLRGVLGVAMFETSLRTRVGFASAAHRLGLGVVEVDARRASAESMPESMTDTVRTLSGYVDALVVRAPESARTLSAAARPDVAWLNAGDRGDAAEHPSQALLDLFAVERLTGGRIADLHLAICGDLRMRSARSLLALLARRPPRRLTLMSHSELSAGFLLPGPLDPITSQSEHPDLAGVSALIALGIPHGAASEPVRSALRVDRTMLTRLPDEAIVLSPMPIIDEIATSARRDRRMRYFEQSDLGLHVRIALLELLLGRDR